jgi:hypothetical protein
LKDEAIELGLEESTLDELGVNDLSENDMASHTATEGALWVYLDLKNKLEDARMKVSNSLS